MHSPEHFLTGNLTTARNLLTHAFDPNTPTEALPESLYEGTAAATIAYLTDALIGAGLADKVRELIEMTHDNAGEPLLQYATNRLAELGER